MYDILCFVHYKIQISYLYILYILKTNVTKVMVIFTIYFYIN